jgi:hypothetical protein
LDDLIFSQTGSVLSPKHRFLGKFFS